MRLKTVLHELSLSDIWLHHCQSCSHSTSAAHQRDAGGFVFYDLCIYSIILYRQSEGGTTNETSPFFLGFSFSWLSVSVFFETQWSQQAFGSCDVGLAVVCVCSAPLRLHRKLSKIPSLLPTHCLLPSLLFSAYICCCFLAIINSLLLKRY